MGSAPEELAGVGASLLSCVDRRPRRDRRVEADPDAGAEELVQKVAPPPLDPSVGSRGVECRVAQGGCRGGCATSLSFVIKIASP